MVNVESMLFSNSRYSIALVPSQFSDVD